MPTRKTQTIIYLTLGIFFGALVLCAGMIWMIKGLQDELARTQRAVTEVYTRQEQVVQLTNVLEETEAERAELAEYLISDDDVINFLALVEALGESRGASVSTEALTVTERTERTESLQLSLKAEGEYGAVLYVLETLETLPYQSSVESALIRKTSGVGNVWQATLTVRVGKHIDS